MSSWDKLESLWWLFSAGVFRRFLFVFIYTSATVGSTSFLWRTWMRMLDIEWSLEDWAFGSEVDNFIKHPHLFPYFLSQNACDSLSFSIYLPLFHINNVFIVRLFWVIIHHVELWNNHRRRLWTECSRISAGGFLSSLIKRGAFKGVLYIFVQLLIRLTWSWSFSLCQDFYVTGWCFCDSNSNLLVVISMSESSGVNPKILWSKFGVCRIISNGRTTFLLGSLMGSLLFR